jgi:ABC-type glycerol-3-phosphate transport system substrate-binding protein
MVPRSPLRLPGLFALLARLLAAGLLAAGLLTGCAIMRPTPTPQPVTLRYACTDPQNTRYPRLIEEFREKYPHITIEVNQSYETADVMMAPILYVTDAIENEYVIALDAYMEGDSLFAADAFMPGTLEMLRSEGRLWGLPAGVDPLVLYYSKDLFDAAGAAYPQTGWNWDDFIARAGAVTNPMAGVYGYVPMDAMTEVVGFIYQHGGGFLDSLTNPTRPTFDDPRNAEAIEWWLALSHTHGVAPTSGELVELGTPQAAVYTNKVAMWIGWFADRGGSDASSSAWPAPWKFRWGAAALPRDAASTALAQVSAYFISAQCKQPDAAWAWIAFLSQRAVHESAPARVSVLEGDDYEKLAGADVAEMVRGLLQGAQMLSPSILRYQGAFEVLSRQMQSIMQGDTTPQDALDMVQKVAEQAQP